MTMRRLMRAAKKDIPSFISYAAGTALASATLTIAKPVGLLTGDLLVAILCNGSGVGTYTPPAGWTNKFIAGASPNLRVDVLTAGGAEPANYSWTLGSAAYAAGQILLFRNGIWDAVSAAQTFFAGPGVITVPGISVAGGRLIVPIACGGGTLPSISTPPGMSLTELTYASPSMGLAVFHSSVAGPTSPPESSTVSSGSGGIQIAIKAP